VLPRILRYFVAAAALLAAYYCFVFGRAAILFNRNTAESVPEAVSLVPYNSDYLARLAAWQPLQQVRLLHRAVELNPFAYGSYLQLGLIAELQHHDSAAAERYFLQAAQVNNMFLPKWTLTNFYFRQQQPDKFFKWARATLEITPYSADPVFTQMWLMSQDASQLASVVPDRPGILLAYANFLANTAQYAAIPPVIQRLTSLVPAQNASAYGRDDQIEPMEDRLLAAGQLQPALRIWSALYGAGWISLPAPTPKVPITNGDFSKPFLNHGFDWKISPVSGVTIEQNAQDKSVRIVLNGEEPEHCVLLEQCVPMDIASKHQLSWQSEAPDGQIPPGMAWHLRPLQGSALVQLISPDLSAANRGSWAFESPSSSNLYSLALEYSRPLGSVRASGAVVLRSITLRQ
jgi:tetratricopeptide (TPR) repeat protein